MRVITALAMIAVACLASCTNAQTSNTGSTPAAETVVKTNLTATEFNAKIKELPAAPIIDVRTPGEFDGGHLANALNYNWNDGTFAGNISKLDKSKPVFVYCLSGGRSAAAAQKMRADGFKEVYEMDGGLMKWRAANLPETTDKTVAKPMGMTKQEYDALLKEDKIVLVDFYADWCAPCKKMKPYLDEIARDMAGKVEVVRINADENPQLCKYLGVDALPVLKVYKQKAETWSNTGFIEKDKVLEQLK